MNVVDTHLSRGHLLKALSMSAKWKFYSKINLNLIHYLPLQFPFALLLLLGCLSVVDSYPPPHPPPPRAPYDEDAASLWYSNNRHFCYLYAVTYLKEVTYLDGVTYDCSVKYVNGVMCNNCSVMNL